jgi:hypothetical protein
MEELGERTSGGFTTPVCEAAEQGEHGRRFA